MEQLYKYIDENTIKKAPPYVVIDDWATSNPPSDMLREMGYKELIDTPYPDTDEGYYRDFIYENHEENIVKVWSNPKEIEYDD